MKKVNYKKLKAKHNLQDWELKICMNIAETVPYGFDEVVYQYIAAGKSFDLTVASLHKATELVIQPKDALYIVMHPKTQKEHKMPKFGKADGLEIWEIQIFDTIAMTTPFSRMDVQCQYIAAGRSFDLTIKSLNRATKDSVPREEGIRRVIAEEVAARAADRAVKEIVAKQHEKLIRGINANIERNRNLLLLGGFKTGRTLPHPRPFLGFKVTGAGKPDPIKTVEQVTVEALNREKPHNHGEWEAGRCVGGGLRYYAVHKNWEKFESYSQAEADRLIAELAELGHLFIHVGDFSKPLSERLRETGHTMRVEGETLIVAPAKPADVEPRKSIDAEFAPPGFITIHGHDVEMQKLRDQMVGRHKRFMELRQQVIDSAELLKKCYPVVKNELYLASIPTRPRLCNEIDEYLAEIDAKI